jgi:DNA-binding transcriptional ArsR family regulator
MPTEEIERLSPFFLNPDLQLVHSLLSIETYAKAPQKLSSALGMPLSRVDKALATLRRLGLITVIESGIKLNREVIHLPADSHLYRPYRQLLKQRALAQQEWLPETHGYALSLLFTSSKAVEGKLRTRLLAVLKDLEPEVRAAPSEELYFLGIDLFPWCSTANDRHTST